MVCPTKILHMLVLKHVRKRLKEFLKNLVTQIVCKVREFSVLLPVGSAGIRYAVLESLFKEWFPLFTFKEVKSLCR